MLNATIQSYTDTSTSQDSLNIGPYYSGLSKYIQTCKTPMTFSIQGEWGTGKTSALKSIEQAIKATNDENIDKCHFIWFNTWQYSSLGFDDNLFVPLFKHLLFELNNLIATKDNSTTNTNIAIKQIGKKLSLGLIKNFFDNKGLGEIVNSLLESLELIGSSENPTPNTEKVLSLKLDIEKVLHEIIPEKERLIIFVDDLDRLEPKVAVNLLSTIKNLMDFERCIFVLAVDKEVITHGVKEKYGDYFDDKKATQFFDKIIQVPFSLPTHQYDIRHLLETEYLDDTILNSEYKNKYIIATQGLFEQNPRSIKRIFNSWELYKCILQPTDARDIYNLFIMLALQLSDENLYDDLVKCARENNLKSLSDLLYNNKNAKYFELPVKNYEELQQIYENVLTDNQNIADLNQAEREWKSILSILTGLPKDQSLFSNINDVDFSDSIKVLLQSYYLSKNQYQVNCLGNSLCHILDKDNHCLLRFYKTNEMQERLVVYKPSSFENDFKPYYTSKVKGCDFSGNDNHITFMLDKMNTSEKLEKLKNFLIEIYPVETSS